MHLLHFVLPLVLAITVTAKFSFSFSDKVLQCQPVSIDFGGSAPSPSDLMTLSLIPFNSTPISIPVPSSAVNSSGIYVSFIPLPQDMLFVASIDDSSGNNSAKITDVIRVYPSNDTDTSCLPTDGSVATPSFVLPSEVSQCGVFTVSYPSATAAPAVRIFQVEGGEDEATMYEDFPKNKTATYVLPNDHGSQVVIVAGDEGGWASSLLTVDGDSQSITLCQKKTHNDNKSESSSTPSPVSGVSSHTAVPSGVVVGLSVGAGVVVLVSVLAAFYFLRIRRKKRTVEQGSFDPNLLHAEKRHSLPPLYYPNAKDFVKDPPYTMDEKFSPDAPGFGRRNSAGSWMSDSSVSQTRLPHQSQQSFGLRTGISYDIEAMLNDATIQDRYSGEHSPMPIPDIREPEPIAVATPTSADSVKSRRRTPKDVPPVSMTFSTYSEINESPFGIGSVRVASSAGSYADSSNFTFLQPPSAPVKKGLPNSPRTRLTSRFSASDMSMSADGRSIHTQSSDESWGNLKTVGE